MAQFKINTLLLQIKLLLWKNYKLKTRRWKEILLMIGFAVFSMLLIGVFRSDIETTTIPAYEPSPQRFFDYLQSNYHLIDGKLAIINKLSDNIENTQKILSLQSSLSQWFNNYHNNITIITNITSDTQLDNIIQTQNNDTSSNIANEIRLAIDINKWDLNNFDYTIRLPSTWVPSSSDPLINQQTSTASITQTLGIGHSYATQFIPLQIWLDEFYIQYNNNYTTNNTSIIPYLSINLQYQQFWTKSHQNDPFMDSMGSLLPFYIVSCFLLPFSYMIKDIVEEKSAKIKEGMRTMGLHILSFWISWFITYLCLISIVSSIIIFIQWKTSMFLHTSFGVLYLLYLLYGFSIITFASAMTTFFDKPKTASTVSGFVYFLLQMPAYAIKSELDTIGLSYKILFSLSSPTGMFLCLLSIIKLEQNGKGYTFNNLFDTNIVPAVQNGYTLGYSMIILFIDIIIYIIFTWFLDQYIQSQYGQKLTIKQIFSQICCCNILSFTNLFSSNNISYKPLSNHQRHSLLSDESSDNILLAPNNNDIEMDNINNNINISNDKFKNISIQMINLSKTYQGNGVNSKSVYAVNDLTMNIYESECCAILGHNGAGKSTMINMLTGMIDVTSGTANINGYSINNEMNEIRQFLGVCPQHDKLEEQLIDGILYVFSESNNQISENNNKEDLIILNGIGRVLISLGIRLIKHRLLSSSNIIRQESCDLISRIACVIYESGEIDILKHLATVLDELLGEEYPDLLGSILLIAYKNIITIIGIKQYGGLKIKDLLPKLPPIMKNRHEKVQENCIDLIGKIADFGSEYVSPREWMRISSELLDILKAHKKCIRRCAVNTFGYIPKAIGTDICNYTSKKYYTFLCEWITKGDCVDAETYELQIFPALSSHMITNIDHLVHNDHCNFFL